MQIHHLALKVEDVERSCRFYRDVLGLDVVERETQAPARSVWLRAGDVVLMLELELRGGAAQEGSAHVIAFAVEDLKAWETRLATAGVSIADRTEHTLYVRDPDGHRIGLSRFVFLPAD